MPDVSNLSSKDAAKTLLHKCLSQFTRQQQIHAQQAVSYLRGFGDGISSHKTVPMLSTLLLSFVKEKHSEKLCPNEMECVNDDDLLDDDIEPTSLCIELDNEGKLVDSHQIHHYWYRSDSLAHLSFYDFCRCIRLEPKSKSEWNKNTHENRAGILRRHTLKNLHPLSDTHFLIEHTNEERGELKSEVVPWIAGMSIPHEVSLSWYVFALTHFKPFRFSKPLTNKNDWKTEYDLYNFKTEHKKIMTNWNAVHECEDERDTDRLQKREKETKESKAMTAALLNNDIEDDNTNFNDKVVHDGIYERNFRNQQFVSILQQGKWLNSAVQDAKLDFLTNDW
jgi:hypothetical protein